MNEAQKERFMQWLRDAHAMELGLIDVLEKQIEDTEGKPAMQERLREHLEETRNHAALMKGCLARYDDDNSVAKDWIAKIGSAMNGFGMSMMSDEMVKNVLSSYAAEHFEIAAYTALQAAARDFGDMETADVCEEILADEEEMAEWLLEQLPSVANEHLQRL